MRKNAELKATIVIAILFGALGCLLFGCDVLAPTVAPKENRPTQIAYSGNTQTAGVLGWADDGGVAISDSKRDEYNGLIDIWATDPRLGGKCSKHDEGMTRTAGYTDKAKQHHNTPAWSLDREHVVLFSKMKSWQERGDKPPGAVTKLIQKL